MEFLTALHGFISTDTSKRINLRHAQRLPSWGTRHGTICRVMCPLCGALNRATWGRTEQHALFLLSEEAVVAIQDSDTLVGPVPRNGDYADRGVIHTHDAGDDCGV
jgi:hypothetical protein